MQRCGQSLEAPRLSRVTPLLRGVELVANLLPGPIQEVDYYLQSSLGHGFKESQEPCHPKGISPPCSLQQKRSTLDSLCPKVSAGGVQEKNLLCCGLRPREYSPAGDEVGPHAPGFPEKPGSLALPTGLGPQKESAMLGAADGLEQTCQIRDVT